MSDFLDRVPTPAKAGWRELEVVEAGTSGLTVGVTFKAKVDFADEPTEVGTPFAKSNIATPTEALEAIDDSKIVTAYSLSLLSTTLNDSLQAIALGGLVY
jgi:hypothetical protein